MDLHGRRRTEKAFRLRINKGLGLIPGKSGEKRTVHTSKSSGVWDEAPFPSVLYTEPQPPAWSGGRRGLPSGERPRALSPLLPPRLPRHREPRAHNALPATRKRGPGITIPSAVLTGRVALTWQLQDTVVSLLLQPPEEARALAPGPPSVFKPAAAVAQFCGVHLSDTLSMFAPFSDHSWERSLLLRTHVRTLGSSGHQGNLPSRGA